MSRKNRYHLHVYVPPEHEEVVKEFVKRLKAKNESASQKIVSWIVTFVINNYRINPQTRLDQLLPHQIPTCIFCDKPATHVAFKNKTKLLLCKHHLETKRHLFKAYRKLKRKNE